MSASWVVETADIGEHLIDRALSGTGRPTVRDSPRSLNTAQIPLKRVGTRRADSACMTSPRLIQPGRTWLVTRRTTRRHFLLRPDADGTTQDLYWYTTAVLAKKFGIAVHAVQVLSNHMHEVLTDVRGKLPDFLRERNRALANALKRHRDWAEEVFQRAPASCVEIYGVDALCRAIGYTIANCVEAGLVDDPASWPGVRVLADEIGHRTVTLDRPQMYFRPSNPVWPAVASLDLTMPDALVAAYGANARDVVRRAVARAIGAARDALQRGGAGQSVTSLTGQSIERRAQSSEPRATRNPQFSTAGDPQLTRQAVEERSAFQRAYRRAFAAIGDLVTRVPFPIGTWRWARELRLPVALLPAPS